jgi:thiol-disulfide isomerase/thioredoxin
MHKLYTLFSLTSLGFVLLLSCKRSDFASLSSKVSISGQIANKEGNTPILIKGVNTTKLMVNTTGEFKLDTIIKHPSIATFEYGQMSFPIYLSPGQDINIKVDTRQYRGGAEFTAGQSIENKFLLAYEEFKSNLEPQDYKSFFSSNEKDFLVAVELRNEKINQFQQDYQKKHGTFSKEFAETFQSEVDHDAAILRMTYPEYYKYFNPDSTLVLSENYESFFQNISIDDDKSMSLPTYREFIRMYLDYQIAKDTSTEKSQTEKYFDQISTHFQSGGCKSYLYYKVMKDAIDYRVNEVTPLLAQYQSLESNDRYVKEINIAYNKWQPLLKGNTAPDFTYKDISGKDISLSSLKGKVVYIDVWATWCGPCLSELPFLEKLQQTFKTNKDVAFVSVSIDKDANAWKKMVKEKSMKGIQIIAQSDWNSQIVRDYIIQGIPRFIIIGKEGQIIDANSIRPSNSKLVKILTQASQS